MSNDDDKFPKKVVVVVVVVVVVIPVRSPYRSSFFPLTPRLDPRLCLYGVSNSKGTYAGKDPLLNIGIYIRSI